MKEMYNNTKETLKKIGINTSNQTLLDILVRILHLIPALMEDGHTISFGTSDGGKTTLILKSTPKNINLTKISSPTLFGDKKTKEDGAISNDNEVAFIEQASRLNNLDEETMNNLLTHCNGDEVKRVDTTCTVRTSIVLLGNCDLNYIPTLENPYPNFDKEFLKKFPDEIKEIQGLGRFIVIPSFLLEKINPKYVSDEHEKLVLNRRKYIDYETFNGLAMREYKEKCKVVTTLNYFLNKNEKLDINDWKFQGFTAIANSIHNLKHGKYEPFYYKNQAGSKLALALILNHLPKDSIIEEAHFFKHRALIKILGDEKWYKVALDISGKFENRLEYEYFKNNGQSQNVISPIISIEKDDLILIQKYIPLWNKEFLLTDLNFIGNENNLKITQLDTEVQELKNKINILTETVNSLIASTFNIKEDLRRNFYLPPFLPFDDEKNDINLKEQLKEEFSLKLKNLNFSKNKIKDYYLGIKNNEIYLVNFAEMIVM